MPAGDESTCPYVNMTMRFETILPQLTNCLTHPQLYVERGNAYRMKGEYDRASEDYDTAISLRQPQ